MKTLIAIATVATLGLVTVAVTRAEKRASPHEEVSATVGGKKITISYGRPYKKGREIFGALVPWGQVWRTGADEATTLTTDGDVTIGELKVPKGSYALFTIPGQKEWQLVVNNTAKQWGAFKYDAKDDLGKTTLKVAAVPAPVEQLTISLEPAGKKVTLKIAWDKTVASTSITP
ncbi:MAG TPA: DUF2911 domain-containing protein [Polyangia bacterium]|jgi:hypothetical protein